MKVKRRVQWFMIVLGIIITGWVGFRAFWEAQQYQFENEAAHSLKLEWMPESLLLCGEPIHFPDEATYLRYRRYLKAFTASPKSIEVIQKRAALHLPQFDWLLKEEKMPLDLKYIPVIESALLNKQSPKAAAGFWELVPVAAEEQKLIIDADLDERLDMAASTRAACRMLRQGYQDFDSWALALAAFNRGPNAIKRAIEKQSAQSFYDLSLNKETALYVIKLIVVKDVFEHPEKYGLKVIPYRKELANYIKVNESVPDLRTWAAKKGIDYRKLKKENPWIKGDRLLLRPGKTQYIVKVSSGTYVEPEVTDSDTLDALLFKDE